VTPQAAAAREAISSYLTRVGIDVEKSSEDAFVVSLPGEHKLSTTVSLSVGDHALSINAFVARQPEENHAGVYRWLLERNRRMYVLAFALDHLGDIYLSGKMPLTSVNDAELDKIMGCILEYSDGSFNTLLELGFASSIRREWAWRVNRGESTANLAAFTHLIKPTAQDPSTDH